MLVLGMKVSGGTILGILVILQLIGLCIAAWFVMKRK
jgi:hypothetical protein